MPHSSELLATACYRKANIAEPNVTQHRLPYLESSLAVELQEGVAVTAADWTTAPS